MKRTQRKVYIACQKFIKTPRTEEKQQIFHENKLKVEEGTPKQQIEWQNVAAILPMQCNDLQYNNNNKRVSECIK